MHCHAGTLDRRTAGHVQQQTPRTCYHDVAYATADCARRRRRYALQVTCSSVNHPATVPLEHAPSSNGTHSNGTHASHTRDVYHPKSYANANFPTDSEGRTYHLGTRKGEVANRVLSVGSTQRAHLLGHLLQPPARGKHICSHLSSRGFLTLTGRYNGVPVSIVSTHMGMANMDFVVRECRAVVDGQMAIVRLGTCGAVQPPAALGQLLIASRGSIAVRRDPDAWTAPGSALHYTTSLPVQSDPVLSALLVEEAALQVGAHRVVQGLNATADSFYSSQGRTGSDFDDGNEELITQLCHDHPDLISLEMETFHLLDLARCAKGGSIRAVGMCIALAERYTNRFLDHAHLQETELAGGHAALSALSKVPLRDDASTMAAAKVPGVHYVWM